MTRYLSAVVVIVALAACRAESSEPPRGGAASAPRPAAVQAKGSGTLTIGDTTHTFDVVRCDFMGSAEDGILLRGTGSAPGGGRLSIEVERLAPPVGIGMIAERVTLVLFQDGRREGEWEAARQSYDSKRWSRKEGAQQADGPLIRVSGTELVAADLYTYERWMSRRELDIQSEMTRRETTPERRRELDAERRELRKLREAAGETKPGTLRASCPAKP